MNNVIISKSGIHNIGAFAAKNIRKGAKVIEYVGEKIVKEEAEQRVTKTIEECNEDNGAVYIFELDDEYDIDGNVPYNKAKFLNHSCEPNCETEIIDSHIWITALRDIKQGEELCYNYGYGLDECEEHPCRCGSKNCIGYILDHDKWPKLGRRLRK